MRAAVRLGVEADYIPSDTTPEKARYASLGLDYLIGSIHWVVAPDGAPLSHDDWHDPGVRTLQMLRAVPGSTALLVVNGSLDPVPVALADERPTRWELAWDSAWEHPGERSSAAIGGGLHPDAGDTVVLEPLSLRLYLER